MDVKLSNIFNAPSQMGFDKCLGCQSVTYRFHFFLFLHMEILTK